MKLHSDFLNNWSFFLHQGNSDSHFFYKSSEEDQNILLYRAL